MYGKNSRDDASSSYGNAPKRRRSSPLLDPIPVYEPTPIKELEARARLQKMPTYSYSHNYNQAQYQSDPKPSKNSSESNSEDVEILQHVSSYGSRPSLVNHEKPNKNQPQRKQTSKSVFGTRPVTGSIVDAVLRRRLSEEKPPETTAPSIRHPTMSADTPMMWSPRIPSHITPVKESNSKSEEETYRSPAITKPRIAHQKIISKSRRPKNPLGVSKKVPLTIRIRYLDLIIDEYLNTGHEEEESYEEALREERAFAERAANRNIYLNLVAGLKKRLREKAGMLAKPKETVGVSHNEILIGKVEGTFSIEKRKKVVTDPNEMTETELYQKLLRYLLPEDELFNYGYPSIDPDNPRLTIIPSTAQLVKKKGLRKEIAPTYTCERCKVIYKVDEKRMPDDCKRCIHHPGRLWNKYINKSVEKSYSCCKNDASAGGCSSAKYHVHRGELEMENYMGFVETQPKHSRDPFNHGIFALDCEMCYTTLGMELTRVTVINHKLETVYERLVKPKNPILDYNSKFSGINEGDLDYVETTLSDVQNDLLAKFSNKTILVGHSLDSDMKALKIIHKTFIDTANLFPHKRGLPFKRALKTLMQEHLNVIIQEDAGHDSKEDASASLKLVFWKLRTDVPKK